MKAVSSFCLPIIGKWHMNRFIKVDEVAEELGISKPYAYKIIRRLNEELREKGMITIAGRVVRNC